MEKKSAKGRRVVVQRPLEPKCLKVHKHEYLTKGNVIQSSMYGQKTFRKNSCLWRIHYSRKLVVDRVTLRQFFYDRSFDVDESRSIDSKIRISTQELIDRKWLKNNTKERYHWRDFTNKVCFDLLHMMLELFVEDIIEYQNRVVFHSITDKKKIDATYELGVFEIPKRNGENRYDIGIAEYKVKRWPRERSKLQTNVLTNYKYVRRIIKHVKEGRVYENLHVQKRTAAYKGYYRLDRRGRKRTKVTPPNQQSGD